MVLLILKNKDVKIVKHLINTGLKNQLLKGIK